MKKLLLLFLLLSSFDPAYSQQISSGEIVDSGVSPTTYFYRHLEKFACPEYWERHDMLRSYQRQGYADMLSSLCSQDILSAMIGYVRMQLQIEYSLNHQPVYCTVVLSLDWAYPADPWKRDPRTHH